ncbi:MAG TPA: bifunctional phosphoribosyl-AMP cyclohydrolase/phosphoribosyl-ATP diphosphatase HisIE [Candidatus Dormibacteraeota bacterium]|nr:bifunctional phosphoribosyl-AMP cyclohydrolase/phosphoribosyl-ATP diphosphatase HisIE [Candidatus Dormibacteraeota bacterium]
MPGEDLRWGADGLLPVVVQDVRTKAVLTLAFANREALERTLETRSTWLWSRSRGALWNKGETSGNVQRVVAVRYDCDGDALLYEVEPAGPACHTGEETCFYRTLLAGEGAPAADGGAGAFVRAVEHLEHVIEARRNAPVDASYVAKLFHGGVDRIGKKIGEEATEVVIAAKNGDRAELTWEVGDLLFHTLVLMHEQGVTIDDVGRELLRRAKP